MTNLLHRVRTLSYGFLSTVKQNKRKSIAVFVVVLLLLGYVLFGGSNKNGTSDAHEARVPSVEVTSVAALSAETEPLVLLGEVRSVSQAELRTKKTGEVTRVYVAAGQFVPAGAILAEVSNQSERAMVLSAQGVLAGAVAQYDKITTGARGEDKASSVVQAQAALVTLQSTQDGARSAYSQAYSLAQEAVFAHADDFFSNAYTVNPSFRINSATYDEKKALEAERVRIGQVLEQWKQKSRTTIPNESLLVYLEEAEGDLERVKAFLNQISTFISKQEVSEYVTVASKATQEGTILGARTSVDSARAVLNGSRSSLANALSTAQVTSLSESVIVTGARSEDVRSSEAVVTQARGALANAYAALENTLIRTPIAGTVSTLNVSLGDFLASFDVVAVVANEGALEIESYVSDTARSRIVVGTPAVIDGRLTGTVTSVSPGLDPTTKKSRVTIGITEKSELTNGSFVEVALTDNTEEAPAKATATSSEIRIPISAIKVLPRGFAVFTVSADGVLEAHLVTEGSIVGSKMIIPEGLTLDMKIVTDVRGLSEGDVVEVTQKEI